MAQILCKKSGILFDCQFLPHSLMDGSITHPFFSIPQKKLINLTRDWAANKFTIEQSYLLYLSLLDSTNLIDWRSSAEVTRSTPQIIAANMESLIQCIGRINLISHPNFKLPRFVISYETRTLENSYYWIELWRDACTDWVQSQKDSRAREELRTKIEIREQALNKLIRNGYASNPAKTSAYLAEWAALVGEFPETETPHPITGKPVTISDYWKSIIRAAHDEDKLWRFPRSDIVELIEHCQEYVMDQDIRSHTLHKLLDNGLKNYDVYTGLSEFDLSSGAKYTILSDDSPNTVMDANIKTIVSTAPSAEPKRESFATNFAYITALMKWKVAQRQGK